MHVLNENNHLLVEAAGLLTAGLVLPDHPASTQWRDLGWKWLNRGLQDQIDGYGEYSQHSSNYHRLMLQVVLWAHGLARKHGLRWSRPAYEAIKRSIHWQLALLDPDSGQMPNLGANDGAYILPLTICSIPRITAQSCMLPEGLSWITTFPTAPGMKCRSGLGFRSKTKGTCNYRATWGINFMGRIRWGYLRIGQFTNRPSHADQLHLDLWWRGMNIARDAGTYQL